MNLNSEHGTLYKYEYDKCRCIPCKKAKQRYYVLKTVKQYSGLSENKLNIFLTPENIALFLINKVKFFELLANTFLIPNPLTLPSTKLQSNTNIRISKMKPFSMEENTINYLRLNFKNRSHIIYKFQNDKIIKILLVIVDLTEPLNDKDWIIIANNFENSVFRATLNIPVVHGDSTTRMITFHKKERCL